MSWWEKHTPHFDIMFIKYQVAIAGIKRKNPRPVKFNEIYLSNKYVPEPDGVADQSWFRILHLTPCGAQIYTQRKGSDIRTKDVTWKTNLSGYKWRLPYMVMC